MLQIGKDISVSFYEQNILVFSLFANQWMLIDKCKRDFVQDVKLTNQFAFGSLDVK
jgi:hypothetical protein